MYDNDKFDDILNKASKNLNADVDKIRDAVSSDKYKNMLKNLKDEDLDKINDILSDKEKTQSILNHPQVKAFIKALSDD